MRFVNLTQEVKKFSDVMPQRSTPGCENSSHFSERIRFWALLPPGPVEIRVRYKCKDGWQINLFVDGICQLTHHELPPSSSSQPGIEARWSSPLRIPNGGYRDLELKVSQGRVQFLDIKACSTSQTRPKVLFATFGVLPRSISVTWPRILDLLINPMKLFCEVEIFAFNLNIGEEKVDGVTLDQSTWKCIGADFVQERNQCELDAEIAEIKREIDLTSKAPWYQLAVDPMKNGIRTLYSEKRVADFVGANADKYDAVFVWGPDFYPLNPVDLQEIYDVVENTRSFVFTSNNNNGAGYTNGFCLGKPRDVSCVLDRWSYLGDLFPTRLDYEYLVKQMFEKHGISRRPSRLFFYKIRANNVIWKPPAITGGAIGFDGIPPLQYAEQPTSFYISCHRTEASRDYIAECVKCIQGAYADPKIYIINDCSPLEIPSDIDAEIIRSEFPGAGEILGYYYAWVRREGRRIVVLDQSCFLREKLVNDSSTFRSIWTATHYNRAPVNWTDVLKSMYSSSELLEFTKSRSNWLTCFGCMGSCTLKFLDEIEDRHSALTTLVSCTKCRVGSQRNERVLGVLAGMYGSKEALTSDIHQFGFGQTWEQYKSKEASCVRGIEKVWTGR